LQKFPLYADKNPNNPMEIKMNELFVGLGPAFAVGLALQVLIEWLDGKVFDPFL